MIVESMNEYLEILTGHVYDNDKVVTYKWLSKELEVHVNVAKQVLWEFWQRRKEENDVECTVMLIGDLKSGGMRVEVVRESNLSVEKDKFSVVKSEHLYSVQKSIPDVESLSTYDKGDIRFGAIKCDRSVVRDDEEMSILRWGSLFKDPVTSRPVPKPEKEPKPVGRSYEASERNRAEKKSLNKKNALISPKAGVGSLFAKVPDKKKTNDSMHSNRTGVEKEMSPIRSTALDQSSSSKESKSMNGEKRDKKDLASFFEKRDDVTRDPTHLESPDRKEKETIRRSENDTNVDAKERDAFAKNDDKPKNDKRGVKRNRGKESKSTVKKRKRIIVDDDLSDRQSENEDMKSAESDPEPELEITFDKRERSPSPPRVTHNNGKARVLKVIDQTYEEDGFLVTKKVHVYESCSEDEAEPVSKRVPTKKEPTNVPKAQAKKKQTMLTNFFKKS